MLSVSSAAPGVDGFQMGWNVQILRAFFDAGAAADAGGSGRSQSGFLRELAIAFLGIVGQSIHMLHVVRFENAGDVNALWAGLAIAAACAVEVVESFDFFQRSVHALKRIRRHGRFI